jgi:winged helix-turn helix protein
MRKPICIRPLTEDEQHILQEGLRSSNAFVLRRCQILLASARGQTARVIAETLGCDDQTVRNVISAFNTQGVAVLTRGSSAPRRTPMRPSMRRAASSYVPSCTRVRAPLATPPARGH